MDPKIRQEMDTFFRDSEHKAYLMAMTLTHNHHDALELVQESMLKLVPKSGVHCFIVFCKTG
jgi:DNA-directed RNA polymerase specialized sigma24 family protein